MDNSQEKHCVEEINNALEINTENDLKPLEIIKKKKVLSAKQLEVLANARAKLKANNHERVTKKRLEAEEIENEIQSRLSQYKTGLEAKIVKKAISIKKRQIKKEAALDEVSDDDTPIQKIKEIASKIKQPVELPKYLYV